MANPKLDAIDRRILEVLQKDGSVTNLELAERVGLSPTPCSRRVRHLKTLGIIRETVTLLDARKLNIKLTAIIAVTMDRHTAGRFEKFESIVKTYPEVLECTIVTGQSADILVKAVVPDMDYYQDFLLGRITSIEGVVGVQSSFVLRKLIDKTALPLECSDLFWRANG